MAIISTAEYLNPTCWGKRLLLLFKLAKASCDMQVSLETKKDITHDDGKGERMAVDGFKFPDHLSHIDQL